MRLIVVGPGRAGGSLALAADQAGHEIVGVLSRHDNTLGFPALEWDTDLPEADVVILSVRDEAISEVAARLAPFVSNAGVVAHLSGFTPTLALREIKERGTAIGGFHPLQTLPDPQTGSRALADAFVAIGGDPLGVDVLTHLASSLGMKPFRLDDSARPFEPRLLLDMLPRGEKPQELSRADRGDLAAQAIDRVAMNARQKTPVAPALLPFESSA